MSLSVLLVNTADHGGGAEAVARLLHTQLPLRGVDSLLAVGRVVDPSTPGTLDLGSDQLREPWTRIVINAARRVERVLPTGTRSPRLKRFIGKVTEPRRQALIDSGLEDFDFPGSHRILKERADVVHLHNLHGSYFDLRILPDLSKQVPTVVTLHDQWMFTGHCAYSLDCERWAIGCGGCPYLNTYPAVPQDRTKENLERKRSIYSESRLHISAPTQWLLDQAERSVLSEAIASTRIIRNGIDLGVFHPAPKDQAKSELQLKPDRPLVVFSANRAKSNPFKGWSTALSAFKSLGQDHQLDVVCLGDDGPVEEFGGIRVRYVGRLADPEVVAGWYRAADLFLHSAWSDNSPLVIIEAQACGTPVIATAVGGVPELVIPLRRPTPSNDKFGNFRGTATGVLVAPGSVVDTAEALELLLGRPDLRSEMGDKAALYAVERFGRERFISDTVRWYEDTLTSN